MQTIQTSHNNETGLYIPTLSGQVWCIIYLSGLLCLSIWPNGQESRTTSKRTPEVCVNVSTSALAELVCKTGHKINWDNSAILVHRPCLWQRYILISRHINDQRYAINREQGLLPQTYLTLCTSSSPLIQHVYRVLYLSPVYQHPVLPTGRNRR